MTTCKKCGYIRTTADSGPDYACPQCQAVYAKVEIAIAAAKLERDRVATARATKDWSVVPPEVVRQEAAKVVLSTTSEVPGGQIASVLGVVSADYAYAFGALFESVAGFARNLVGSGKSGQTINFLREGRAEVLNSLRFHALDLGGHAVVGIKIDYEEFSGANNQGIIVVTATGTAVRLVNSSEA